ncbi:UNVERIFIED_CONTAM: hypothetical protein NCL1_08878 [Trichonephila clavipes]
MCGLYPGDTGLSADGHAAGAAYDGASLEGVFGHAALARRQPRRCPPAGGGAYRRLCPDGAADVLVRPADAGVPEQRLQRRLRGAAVQHAVAGLVQGVGGLGRPRGLAAAVGAGAGSLVGGGGALLARPAAGHDRARAGHPRADQRRHHQLHPVHLESVRPPAAGLPDRGQRPQPAAAGPGADLPSAHALHGLCRLRRALRLRPGRPARRTPGPGLGALVAAVGAGGLGLPRAGHRARLVVGLLRAGLGRLVVLGPGRERLLHALAGRHRADPLHGGDREARRVQGLDRAAGHHRVRAQSARHLPGAFRGADLGACLRLRPVARAVHPRHPDRGGGRFAGGVRLARRGAAEREPAQPGVARDVPARQQPAAAHRHRDGAAGHPVPAHRGCLRHRQDLGRPALLQPAVRAADPAAAGVPGAGPAGELEARPARRHPPAHAQGAAGRDHHRLGAAAAGLRRPAVDGVAEHRPVCLGARRHAGRHRPQDPQRARAGAGPAQAHAQLLGHAAWPPRPAHDRARRGADLGLQHREGCAPGAGPGSGDRRLPFPLRGRCRPPGSELCRAARHRGGQRWRPRARAASGEAHLPRAAEPDDRSGDFRQPLARSLCRARRAAGWRCLGGARVPQAHGALDVVRCAGDGAGRAAVHP